MKAAIKNSYKFTSRDEWVNYAMTNMRKIEAQKHNEAGTELWLVRQSDVIGKWCDELNFGYIEEYRNDTRLAEDRRALEEDS